MKTSIKLGLLILLFSTTGLVAQNLMVNGNLESWTGGVPDNWTVVENIYQESTIVHGGSSSAGHISDQLTKDFQQLITGIQAGSTYTISYWYYDNDIEARTRIWSYWMSGGTTLPDNGDVLRPSEYSTDNPSWIEFNQVLTAPAGADGFRFEVRVYQQDGVYGGSVFYDDFLFSGDVTVDPEPSNYPTSFSAATNGASIELGWTDATGTQLPDAYIIMAGTNSSLPIPVDGTPVPDDTDLSDGSGALNIAYGLESGSFGNLDPNTTYYFTIYPYTNAGTNIDFKTDGTAPSANATTSNIAVIEAENFDVSWGNWTTISVIGAEVWDRDNTYGINNTPCARMSGFNGTALDNEDWLISPGMDFDDYDNESMVFFNAKNYDGNDLECLISTDYSGSGDPNLANWTTLSFTLSGGSWAWTESGTIDLSAYNGIVYVAFKYTCNTTASATWEVDDISIIGEEDVIVDPEPSNYPTSFTATPGTSSITLDWTDATGTQLPDAYIIFAGTSSSLPSPVDGTPVSNDPDLSDGSGAMNIAYGAETYTFSNLEAATTYYFSIYSYTNSGSNIDYKTNGSAPTATTTTILLPEPSAYPTSFNATVIGTQINLTWIDATGSQLPENYILFAGITPSLPVPVDGTPVTDDPDLSDGSAAVNLAYAIEQASFAGLSPSTTYYFSIYPYTNAGANINYKTDGTAPTTNASTSNTVPVVIETENFDVSWGNWTVISLEGENEWGRDNTFGIGSTPCASVTGYISGTTPPEYENSDDWLVSPAFNFDNYENEKIEFFNAWNYTGPDLQFKVSTDYDGGGDPSTATWTSLPYTMSPGSWTWTSSGEIDLSGFNGQAVYVAFHFTSTTAASATWEIDDITISGEEEYVVDPEPSNYPTDFSATGSGTSVILGWTDATGAQLPDKYIIFAGTSASLPAPTDGTPVADDLDLSDGSGAVNVDFGDEEFTFPGLASNQTYYFSIYSYTNSGLDIDYKNDGTAPTANATTGTSPYILYQGFDNGWSGWATISVTGQQVWQIDALYGFPDPPCARMSGYSGGAVENEDWLISPAMNLNNYTNEVLTFYNAQNFDTPPLECKVSTDYNGGGDPYTATWTNITFNLSPGFYEWVSSGEIDLSGFNSNAVYVAFVYTSTASQSATWEIDEILVEDGTASPEPSNYPSNFVAESLGSSIGLSWDDATGAQLPESYIIIGGINPGLTVPTDGTPIADDLDFSDGNGAINVDFGQEQASFGSLDPSTTYYFAIYPYTNSGNEIDYKNDGTAPAANATTSNVQVVTIEYEDFDASWGNWTVISLAGSNQWDRNNTYGIGGTPCASVTGYNGGAYETSNDWLISPALNFDNYDNEKVEFYNAMNYTGPDLELKVSTNYDGGGDPTSATWTSLPFTMSSGGFTWVLSGEVDLSSFNGTSVYVAFHFTSSTAQSATWEVDEIRITGEEEVTIDPEPTNYPGNFTAGAAATNILLSWTDATGTQLPDSYIIFAGTDSSLPVPVDGQPVANDLNLSDGSGALNVAFGEEEAIFSNLEPAVTYYFSIYSYTNVGVNINFKNDGTAPTSSATAGYSPYILYQGFDDGFGDWDIISVTGSQTWQIDAGYGYPDPPCARMSGYGGGSAIQNEDWLVSPPMNLDNYSNEVLTFWNAQNFDTPPLVCKISTDYNGGGDPYTANWTDITFNLSPGFYEWVSSGEIDLSGFNGTAVYVAFIYTSTNTESATWEIDEILVEDGSSLPEPSNYPTNFSADGSGSSILVSFTDATGIQIPEGYILYGNTNAAALPVPLDGTPVSDDTDLSDGAARVNLDYGDGEFNFGGLSPNTTYYFTIYPYTNSGSEIDYKTDGTPPAANAITENVVLVTLTYENFDNGWGDWTPISVVGSQTWTRDNTYGINNTPCAQMSGYSGGSYYDNEDWLISPALNLDNYQNELVTFQNAQNYSGPDLKLRVSTNYDGGGDPNSASWTDLSFNMSGGGFAFVSSGDVDISGFDGSAVYVAFYFTSTSSGSATWELDEVSIKGEEDYVVQPEPTNYPLQFTGTGLGLDLELNWNESTGAQLPHGYLIYAGLSDDLPIPADGIPLQNDSDLSDGIAAVNVDYGESTFTFSQGSQPYTTYYFAIYPYTNYGADRNYKNDGTAPTTSAVTTNYIEEVIEEEGFNASWGNWELVNVAGWQEWDRLNQYGPDNTNCAAISGYDYGTGQNVENNDWLISPPMNFNNYVHERITFYNAKNYNGPDMELKISTNYNGDGEPQNATWTSLPYIKSDGDFNWVASGEVDLSAFDGENVYVAFHYTCTTSQSANWEVDIIKIIGKQVLGINPNSILMPEVKLYPNPMDDYFTVHQDSDYFSRYEIKSLDARTAISGKLNGLFSEINVSELKAGIYFISLIHEESGLSYTEKLIVK
ncbi:MAG: choice-of-anchor J domain-containing protein [Bacteroidales bacterium]|nr:choice-of-anchor J domain-containing protein [Bacteroidales bacterium]MCF8404692.1 choice-of-anchor J domain-containing protein [Bacteroidales bacterium]